MKKISCGVLVVVLTLMAVAGLADGSSEYMYYAEATIKIEDLMEIFIGELNEKIDNNESLTEVEKTLYFQYLRTFLDLKEVYALQYDAISSNEITQSVSAQRSSLAIFSGMVDSAENKYTSGEATFEDAVNGMRPIIDTLLGSAE